MLAGLAAVALVAYHFTYLLRGTEPRPHSRQLLALCFLVVVARPLLAAAELRTLLLALSTVGFVAFAGLDSIAIFGFALLVITLSRSRLPLWLRLGGVALLWFAAIVPKLWLTREQVLPHMPVFVYWSGIPFSAIYLVVERQRGALEGASWLDDALYMLALPRIASPFFQAYSPAMFLRSQLAAPVDLRLAWRGAVLLLYGSALFVLMAVFPYIPPPGAQPVDLRLADTWRAPHNLVFVYAANASAIFCAVGMFRLMGFDMSSGFRFPLLATSFAEFYRRWNHYVYDSVKSLLLFPLLGRLRTFLPDAVAGALAAYLAIFAGSYCLGQILVPLALDPSPRMVLRQALDPYRLLVLSAPWTLIILPQLLPRRQSAASTLRRRVIQRAIFITLLTAIAYLATELGVILI